MISPRPDDALDVEFCVDPQAEPGNVVPALARLLIDLAQHLHQQDGPAREQDTGAIVCLRPHRRQQRW
jgi:hypothetical protein